MDAAPHSAVRGTSRATHQRTVRRVAAAAALAAAIGATACTEPGISPAAFPTEAVTLTLGVPDSPGRYAYQVTDELARRITESSDGQVVAHAEETPFQVPRWNQLAIEAVQDGSYDILVVQSQAFDVTGVDTVKALYVPFLITDEEHLDAVATSDVADDILDGFEGTGVTGLAIVPGGMRRLFNEEEAPTRPGDLAGEGVRVAYSEVVWRMVEAFGGRPDDPNGEDLEVAYRDGRVSHLDSTFQLVDGFLETPKAAADVTIYPLAFAVVANDEALDRLTAEQRELIVAAAREVALWAAQTRPSDADEARALCSRSPGAEIVIAGADAVAEWRTAAAPLAAELRADPVVRALAQRIEQVGAQLTEPAEPVTPCSGGGVEPVVEAQPNVPETFPEGVYRKEVTVDDLLEHGVNIAGARREAGVWTLPLRDGRVGDEDEKFCPGSTYEIVDDRIVVTMGPEGPTCGTAAGRVLFSAGWRLDGDRLTFTDVRSGHGSELLIQGIFGGEPWTRIG